MAAHWRGGHYHDHLKRRCNWGNRQWQDAAQLGKLRPQHLDSLSAEQLRALAAELIAQVAQREQAIAAKDGELKYRQAKIDQFTHDMAVLKRWRFGRSGERLDTAQLSLLDETIDADIAAIEVELEQLAPTPRAAAQTGQPKRARAATGVDSPRTGFRPVRHPKRAAARSNALGKMSAKSSTTPLACSQSSATCGASGPTLNARA